MLRRPPNQYLGERGVVPSNVKCPNCGHYKWVSTGPFWKTGRVMAIAGVILAPASWWMWAVLAQRATFERLALATGVASAANTQSVDSLSQLVGYVYLAVWIAVIVFVFGLFALFIGAPVKECRNCGAPYPEADASARRSRSTAEGTRRRAGY